MENLLINLMSKNAVQLQEMKQASIKYIQDALDLEG